MTTQPTLFNVHDLTWRPGRQTIKDLPATERPVERLQKFGAGSLALYELLTIVTGSHQVLGEQLLTYALGYTCAETWQAALTRIPIQALAQIPGIGPASAAKIKAALELAKRFRAPEGKHPQIRSPADAYALLRVYEHQDLESLFVLPMDTRNRVLCIEELYKGNVNTSVVRVAEVLRIPIRLNAPALILAHNHPSGDPTPSVGDISTTDQIRDAGKLLNIDLLDHIIIAEGRFLSLKERGLGFSS